MACVSNLSHTKTAVKFVRGCETNFLGSFAGQPVEFFCRVLSDGNSNLGKEIVVDTAPQGRVYAFRDLKPFGYCKTNFVAIRFVTRKWAIVDRDNSGLPQCFQR